MSSATALSDTRSALSAMVEREARTTGSRTVAYERVASMVGTSASWVRKFLAGSIEAKEPRITLFLNIRQAYSNLCERVEQQNRNDELRLRTIEDGLDAIAQSFGPQGLAQDQAGLEVDHGGVE